MRYLFVIYLLSCFPLQAQKDSTRPGLSAFQVDIGTGFYLPNTETDQRKLQTFKTQEPMLDADLQGFSKDNSYKIRGHFFEGIAGAKFFFKRRTAGRKKTEFFIGLRLSQYVASGVTYNRFDYDTISNFTDPVSGKNRVVIRRTGITYNYTVRGNLLLIPLGMNYTTSHENFFWFTAGMEIAPVIVFNHKLVSSLTNRSDYAVVDAGGTTYHYGYNLTYFASDNANKIRGAGTGLYAGMPLAVYLHPFRKETNGLEHIHFFTGVTPIAVYLKNKFSAANAAFTLSFFAGVRINY